MSVFPSSASSIHAAGGTAKDALTLSYLGTEGDVLLRATFNLLLGRHDVFRGCATAVTDRTEGGIIVEVDTLKPEIRDRLRVSQSVNQSCEIRVKPSTVCPRVARACHEMSGLLTNRIETRLPFSSSSVSLLA